MNQLISIEKEAIKGNSCAIRPTGFRCLSGKAQIERR